MDNLTCYLLLVFHCCTVQTCSDSDFAESLLGHIPPLLQEFPDPCLASDELVNMVCCQAYLQLRIDPRSLPVQGPHAPWTAIGKFQVNN